MQVPFLQHDWLFVWKPIFLSNSGINCATKILENDDLFPIEFAATSVSVTQVDISRGVVENLLIKIILWKQTHHNVDWLEKSWSCMNLPHDQVHHLVHRKSCRCMHFTEWGVSGITNLVICPHKEIVWANLS